MTQRTVRATRHEVARLLVPYARHDPDCGMAVRDRNGEPESDVCTCGYTDATRELYRLLRGGV